MAGRKSQLCFYPYQLRDECPASVDAGEREIFRAEMIVFSEDMAADPGILELYRGP